MSPDNRFKFDVDTQRVLRSAGWTEDRFVSADKWIRELTQRGAITFPLANRILENLGGLEIHPPHDPRELFMPSEILLNPSCVASEFDRVDLWQNEYSLTLFPLASRIELGLWNDTARTFTIFICSHCGKPTFFEGDRPLPGVAPGNSVIHLPVDVEALYTEARNCVAAS